MKKSFIQVGIFIGSMWGVFILSRILPFVNDFGIIPRHTVGLIGVFSAPLLHLNVNHIVGNSIALLTFAPIFVFVVGKNAVEKIIVLTVITGFLTWCFAGAGNHIGASGLVFALYGYLISLGYFKRNFKYMALSAFLLVSYGYMILGVFPLQAGVSWESHLFGALAGAVVARVRDV